MKKCPKTLSGKHLFMPIYMDEWFITGTKKYSERQLWRAHGISNPMKCIACEIIDDTKNTT